MPTFTSDLIGIRFRDDDGSESAATWRQLENVNDPDAPVDTNLRIRFEIQETAGGSINNETWQLQVDVDGGGFTNVGLGSSVVRSVGSGNFADDDNCTQQLGGSTPFVGLNGMDEADGITGVASYAGNDFGGVPVAGVMTLVVDNVASTTLTDLSVDIYYTEHWN